MGGNLSQYDWLHLHHEDFTGQYGKFYGAYRDAAWYINQKSQFEAHAKSLGYNKVSDVKGAVAEVISEYVNQGGFLFAMCSATDSYDMLWHQEIQISAKVCLTEILIPRRCISYGL